MNRKLRTIVDRESGCMPSKKEYIIGLLIGTLISGLSAHCFIKKGNLCKNKIQTKTRIENCEYGTEKPLIKAYKPNSYTDLVALVKNMPHGKMIEVHQPSSLKQISRYWPPCDSNLTKLTKKLSNELGTYQVKLFPDKVFSLDPVLYIHKELK